MRRLAIPFVVAVTLMCAAALPAAAADRAPRADPAIAMQQQPVEQHEGTRVEVQLVVLGAALVAVLVIGSAGYLLRKKLGLVAGPPEQPAGGHH